MFGLVCRGESLLGGGGIVGSLAKGLLCGPSADRPAQVGFLLPFFF